MKRYLSTIRSDEAVQSILSHVNPIDEEEYLPAHACKGRITTRAVFARQSNPPFLCSAMDGYAVLSSKTLEADMTRPVFLSFASEANPVNTGDPLPKNTDAVIMAEEVERSGTGITVRKPAYLWQNVRMIGEDVIEGDMLFPANHRITTFDTGMFLSAGITHVHVRRKPTVLIIPTGKELVDIYERPRDNTDEPRLVDFNSYLLANLAEDIGFRAERSRILVTKEELLSAVQEGSTHYDVIIINAGSSAGTEDFTESVLRELGTLIFHGVSMMPGKPTLFGVVNTTPVIGLPGYPVSAATAFRVFLEPLYEKLMATVVARQTVTCVTPYKVPSRIGIEEILRVNIISKKDRYYAFPLARGASIYSSLANADGLIRVPEAIEGFEEGTTITCELLRDRSELDRRIHVIGSHDLSLGILRDMLRKRTGTEDLLSTHVGSMSGIMAFGKGITDLCTTHVLDEQEKVYNIPIVKRYVPDKDWLLVNIAKRTQGLLVRKGNPKSISGIADLGRNDVTFVNRQVGSGTRILLDAMLREHAISRDSVRGYEREESSHTSVAVLVREGVADTGIAIHAVARVFGLDFIPLAEEDYDLLVTEEFSRTEGFQFLLELIASAEFRSRLHEVGGYNTEMTGTIKYRHTTH